MAIFVGFLTLLLNSISIVIDVIEEIKLFLLNLSGNKSLLLIMFRWQSKKLCQDKTCIMLYYTHIVIVKSKRIQILPEINEAKSMICIYQAASNKGRTYLGPNVMVTRVVRFSTPPPMVNYVFALH